MTANSILSTSLRNYKQYAYISNSSQQKFNISCKRTTEIKHCTTDGITSRLLTIFLIQEFKLKTFLLQNHNECPLIIPILLRTNTKTKQAQGKSDWNMSSTSSGIHTSVSANKIVLLAKPRANLFPS